MSREDDRRLSTADFLSAGEHKHHDEEPPVHAGMDPVMLQRMQQQHDQGAPNAPLQQVETMRHEPQQMQMRSEPVQPQQGQMMQTQGHAQAGEQLAALFLADVAQDFRRRWDAIQIGFVDDPQEAVRSADELVAEVMKTLAESFARRRGDIEAGVDRSGQADTENLRLALHQYRSFFQRLLSL
jgi:hypothetical protein